MEKAQQFEYELEFIKSDSLREQIKELLDNEVPDYFFKVPASSTGKYHPEYALGEGGLVRHTKAAVRIAIGMFPLTKFNDNTKDFIIAALILHDTFKHGKDYARYAKADHPKIAAEFYDDYFIKKGLSEVGGCLRHLIITHMGQWNTDWKTKKEILPKPEDSIQRYVHMCDYLASRKYLEFNFNTEI